MSPRRRLFSRAPAGRAFTLLEVLLALALVALLLVAMNTFVFSMGELWGRGTDVRLFDLHVRAVSRYLEHELRAAALGEIVADRRRGGDETSAPTRP